jgi:sugar lactone lactonase YvrE
MTTIERWRPSATRLFLIFFVAFALSLCSNCGLRTASATRVLGQADFTHSQANQGKMPDASGLNAPRGIATFVGRDDLVYADDRLFVVDNNNNRVLSWPNARTFESGDPADLVIGQPNTVSTQGNWEGKIGKKGLKFPTSIAVCGAHLAVADSGNMRVLLYEAPWSTGMEATKVFGQPGFDTNDANHGGTQIGLNAPAGVAFDCTQPYLYIADLGNNRIVRYRLGPYRDTRDLVIGQKDATSNLPNEGVGSPTLRSLAYPRGLVVSQGGDLYVADWANNRVLGYSAPLGNYAAASILIGQLSMNTNKPNMGSQTSNASSLNDPFDVALDDGGNLYVADSDQNRVLRFLAPLPSVNATANLVIGQPDFSEGAENNGGLNEKSLYFPLGVAVDGAEDLLVSDTLNNRVLKYAYYRVPFDNLPDVILDRQNAKGDRLFPAYGLAVDPKSGRLFVAGGNVILTWKSVAGLTESQLPDAIFGQGKITWAFGVAVDSMGNVWAADADGNRVIRFSFQNNQWVADRVIGQPDFMQQAPSVGQTGLDHPWAVAVDLSDDFVFVADTYNNRVVYYAPPYDRAPVQAKGVIGQHGDFGSNATNDGDAGPNDRGFDGPQGLTFDGKGDLFVADSNNSRVLRIHNPTNNPVATNVFGQNSFYSQLQPHPTNAVNLSRPLGLAVDGQNGLYVADEINNRVMLYNTNGDVGAAAERVFGQQVFVRNDPHHKLRWGVDDTIGVAVDSAGNLLMSDYWGQRVLMYDTPR